MANSRIYFKSEAGGTTVVSRDTTATSGNLVLPASGNVTSVDTAVTDNAIARYDGTTGKLQNSGVIIDDNNSVSINTTSNLQKLSLKGDIGLIRDTSFHGEEVGATIKVTASAVGYSDGSDLVFSTMAGDNIDGGTVSERIRIDSLGNVGIGITPSAWSTNYKVLELTGGGVHSYLTGSIQVSQNAYDNGVGTWKYKNSSTASRYDQGGGQHQWFTAPTGTAGNAITWTNAMTLDAVGNLSLNTSYLSGVYGAITSFGNASTTYFQMIPRNVANNDIVFNSTVGGVTKVAILANGNFQSATNSYGSTSDVKLKENVVETSDKLDKLMNVRVVNFNYIGDDQKQIGVIAQEVEKIFPGIVYETKDTEQVEVTKTRDITDEEGNVTTEEYTETETVETGEVTKNVKYSVIYMMMLKAMQEMREEYTAEINDLKSRIEILEGAK